MCIISNILHFSFTDENGKLKEVHYALSDGQLGNLHFMFRALMDIDKVSSFSMAKKLEKGFQKKNQ